MSVLNPGEMIYKHWANLVVGNKVKVPVEGNKLVRYVNFDNAASTPAFKCVMADVAEFLNYYGNIHRGVGYKSLYSTDIYESSREKVARFIGLDTRLNTVIFVKNTTEAINKLVNCMDFSKKNIVISTHMEHHSNDLPWRKKANVLYARVLEDGALDYDHLIQLFKNYSGKVRILAVTGASNVTGVVNNLAFLAEIAHYHGAEIMVDAAQLVSHRKINMLPDDNPRHIDYLAFSGHKAYAPFGIGVLAGKKETFQAFEPDYVGGGTVSLVSHSQVQWAESPAKNEAGTPNVVGAVALCSAINQLEELNIYNVENYEKGLINFFLNQISSIREVNLYGFKVSERVGTFAFAIEGFDHALVAGRLAREKGIGLRNGCFCAHPYVLSLLQILPNEVMKYQENIKMGNKRGLPGLIRVSLGLYNTVKEIEYFIESLKIIITTPERNAGYFQNPVTGLYEQKS